MTRWGYRVLICEGRGVQYFASKANAQGFFDRNRKDPVLGPRRPQRCRIPAGKRVRLTG